ncbi:RNA pol II accessory factor [Aphelenchoides fujianensis]|nr:RNA pol II accessory factor [Aphelenchoides fujianensis]
MAEPLRLFRDHVQGKIKMAEIEVVSSFPLPIQLFILASLQKGVRYYAFGESAFAASTPTCLKSPTGDYYTLESIVEFWKHQKEPHPSYVRDVSGRGFQDGHPLLPSRGQTHEEPEEFDLTAPMATAVSYSSLLFEEKREKMEPEAKRPRLLNDEPMAAPKLEEAMEIAQLRDSVQKNRKQARPTQPTETGESADHLVYLPFDVASESLMKTLAEMEIPSCSRIQLYSRINDFESLQGYLTVKDAPPTAAQTNGRNANGSQNRSNQRSGYSRYDQEVFGAEPETDFQIDTNLTFHGSSLNAIRGSALANKPGARLAAGGQRRPQRAHARELRAARRDLKYVPTEVRKKTKKREYELVIQRNKGNNLTASYQVIDDPRKLKDEDWDRIVAVFVQGPAWQFKGWKYNQQPTEIFAKMCAFHLKFKEQPLDKNVEKWSVTRLELSQTQRHLDRAVLQKFWEKLDSFMVKNKSHLRF